MRWMCFPNWWCSKMLLAFFKCDGNRCNGGGGYGCFPPGTVVKTPSGGMPIQSIRVGSTVTSFNDQTNKIENSSVSNIYKVHRTFYFSIIAGGYHVDVTAEHPFYTGGGKYKEAQNLKAGDVLYVDQNNNLIPTVVAQNLKVNEPTDAYNMTVDNTHTFFANDFAVHNKGSCPSTDGFPTDGSNIGWVGNGTSATVYWNPSSASVTALGVTTKNFRSL